MLPLIEFETVTKKYGQVTATDKVSFTISENEALGLVGESGCGKTTVANMILGLTDCSSGEIRFRGIPLNTMTRAQKRDYRRQVQLVFQDTKASLNPNRTVRQSIAEPIRNFERLPDEEEKNRVGKLLETVGLSKDAMNLYPDSFSGGQRQRIAIARALALQPSLLVLDEATSGLDVSVQAQILNLLRELKQELGTSYLVISHDMGVVRYLSDRMLVMNQGCILEELRDGRWDLATDPYTRMLIDSVPDIQKRIR